MSREVPRRVVAVVPDLFFAAKIGETAKQVGAEVEFARSAEDLLRRAQEQPALIVLDLNAQGLDTVAAIEQLKADSHAFAKHLPEILRGESYQEGGAAKKC